MVAVLPAGPGLQDPVFQQLRPTCTLVLTGCPDCGQGQDPSSDGMCHLWHEGGSRSLNISLTLRSAADGLGLASAEPCLGTREEQGRPGEGARTAASWSFLHRRCVVRVSPGAWAVRVSIVNPPLEEAVLTCAGGASFSVSGLRGLEDFTRSPCSVWV